MAYQTTQEKAAKKCMKTFFLPPIYLPNHLSKDVKLVKKELTENIITN